MQHIKLLIFVSFFLCSSYQIIAQNKYECLDSASVAYCRGNIRHAIINLEQFIYQYPNDALIEEAKMRVGELYQEMRDYNKAIPIMKSIIELKEKDWEENYKNYEEGFNYQSNFDKIIPPYDEEYKCRQIIRSIGKLKEIKYEACTALYDIYLYKQDFDSSIYYLNIANTNYFPSGGCVNGNNIIKTQIAIKFADAYLLKRDTTNAIKHLFDVIFYFEGSVSSKAHGLLIDLLNSQYSKAQINQALEQAILNAKLIGEGNDKKPYFSIFGNKVAIWLPESERETEEEFRNWLRKNSYLQQLKQP